MRDKLGYLSRNVTGDAYCGNQAPLGREREGQRDRFSLPVTDKVCRDFRERSEHGPKTLTPWGRLRPRWKMPDGRIFEWDYQHGTVEGYDARGRHLGEFDPTTGAMRRGPIWGRKVDP
jgi:hypothetical protein